MSDKFEQFAIVELFGRQVLAGLVSEQVIGGQGFVRVDVPPVDDLPGFTKFYGPGAIYAINPCDEATCIEAIRRTRPRPVNLFIYSRALPDGESEED